MATDPKSTTATRTKTTTEPAAGSGVAAEAGRTHEQRTTVPGAANVDARLDNRVGDDRPPLESFPAKPQQVDGPDVIHQVEHTRQVLADRAKGEEKDGVERKGMFSPGPHGLSDESLREGETTFGTEGLTESEAAKGSPKAN